MTVDVTGQPFLVVPAQVLFLTAWVGFGACGVWWEGKSVEMGSTSIHEVRTEL